MFDVSVNDIRSSHSFCFSMEHCKYELFNQVAYQQRRNSTGKYAKFQFLRFSDSCGGFIYYCNLVWPFSLVQNFLSPINFHNLMKLKKTTSCTILLFCSKISFCPRFCRNCEHLCHRGHLTPSYSWETLRYYSLKAVCSLKQRMWIWIGYLKSIHTQGRAGERGGMDKLSSALTTRLKYRCGFH